MTKTFDAIIIPGGGLESETGLPQPWVRSRLDAALRLSSRTTYFVALSRGTTHRSPPVNGRGFPILESAASAKYLLDNGLDNPKRILLDGWSLDTIGNAFFARNMICQPMALLRCCIITSAFHMPRTRAIFEWVFSLGEDRFQLDYVVTPDIGLDNSMSSARRRKEEESLTKLRQQTIPSIQSLSALSQFLFMEHGAYNTEAAQIGATPCEGKDASVRGTSSIIKSTY